MTIDALEAENAEVALVARVGKDLSRYKLRYSHIGFVVRDHPMGKWTVVHDLNHCGTADSDLFNEGLGAFFLDDMFAYETLVVFPDRDIQHRLALRLTNGARSLHQREYNMVAYPFSTRYQNSNQWVLETLAAASASGDNVRTRLQAQSWLRAAGYRPTTLELDTLTRLGARLSRANVTFDDQPFDRRMAGHIDTVTVDSIHSWMRQRHAEIKAIELKL